MSFRVVVVSKSAKMDLKLNHLVIRNEDIVKILISEIAVLIVENTATSITTALMSELVKAKVKVIFCDEKRNPISELLPYYGSHDSSLKIKMQMNWKKDKKEAVWTEVVKQKISKQKQLLESLGLEECIMLNNYLKELKFNDETNREGHAAKVYFNSMFGKDFTRSQDNNINAALNYGYSMLLSVFNREITSCGYLTQIGIFHDNMFNQFNLASDLMEAFRPLVDKKVKQMRLDKFEKDEKLEIVNILNMQVLIDGQRQYLLNAIKIYVKGIFDVLNEEENAQIKVYGNEL